jgi:hypothetical protein
MRAILARKYVEKTLEIKRVMEMGVAEKKYMESIP